MKTVIKKKPIRLVNNRSGEEWLCDNFKEVKIVDGVEFVEVYKDYNPRKFWMNKTTLIKKK